MFETILLAIRRQIASAILYNHQIAEQLGLSVSEAQFMNLIGIYGPLTPGRLSELSGLSTGAVTGVIDRLEQAGYARRDRETSDRRKVVVSLNQERIDLEIMPLYESQVRLVHDVLDGFDASQLEVIARFLRRLVGEDAEA
jgi:DNA-binding MarR family transcriptional regulator